MALFLSSKDRRVGETPARASYGEYGESGISLIGLSEYQFITQFNNINSSNNTAVLDDGTQSFPITIPFGTYDGTALALAISAQLNIVAAPIVFTVTFTNGRFNMTSTAPTKWTYPNPITGYGDFAQMAGLSGTPFSTSIAGKLANLVYTNKLYITSRSLNSKATRNDFASNKQASGILGVMYLNGNDVRGILTDVKWIDTNPLDTMRTIDIEILDDYGNAIVADEADNLMYDITILTR